MEFVYNENQIALYSEKGKLMETLAKDLEQRDLKTAPTCSYAVKWFENHPEYSPLLK